MPEVASPEVASPKVASVDQIARLYAERGGLHYGEGVTQLEHALQCAALAEAAGAPPSLIAASLLHDIGHLFENEADVTDGGADRFHQAVGAKALAGLFDEAVCGPIALHVAAKRWLCFAEPAYFAALSPASKASLALQGGAFTEAEAAAFVRLPHAAAAITLRRFDDGGKRGEVADDVFANYLPLLRNLARGQR
jgi:phosphonate degradation associated HDIG domain protein